jgi:hypothetical protein
MPQLYELLFQSSIKALKLATARIVFGIMEENIDVVIGRRFKRQREEANNLLKLRILRYNTKWGEFWER